MAITISGSGTISGITAGGLPDGAVTADDLASTLDLSGKTVTLPSGTGGKVLQVSSFYDSTSTVVSATNTWVTIQGSGKTVTAVGSNSKYLYHYVLSAEADQTVGYNCFYKAWYNKNGGAYQEILANRVFTGNALLDSQGTVTHVISVILEGVSSAPGDTLDFYLSYYNTTANTQFNQQNLSGQPSGTTNTSVGYVMEIAP